MRKSKNKKAFTLIELIVVIAVLTILVILAVPKYLEHTAKAEEARIKHNSRVVSDSVARALITEDLNYTGNAIDQNEVDIAIAEGRFYKEGSVVEAESTIGESFTTINESFIKEILKSKPKGKYIVDGNNEIYYISDSKIKGSGDVGKDNPEDEIVEVDPVGCPVNEVGFGNMIPQEANWNDAIDVTPKMKEEIFGSLGAENIPDQLSLLQLANILGQSYLGGDISGFDPKLAGYKEVSNGDTHYVASFNMTHPLLGGDVSVYARFNGTDISIKNTVLLFTEKDSNEIIYKMGYGKSFPDYLYTNDIDGNLESCTKFNSEVPDYSWDSKPTDCEFVGCYKAGELGYGYFIYTGTENIVTIPSEISGHEMKSYYGLFMDSNVTKVMSESSNITNMKSMFEDNQATTLDLSNLDTSNVKNMSRMFYGSQATVLDLSSFDTSNVTDMFQMFLDSKATTGYARTQADADRFNANETERPAGLTFTVKP